MSHTRLALASSLLGEKRLQKNKNKKSISTKNEINVTLKWVGPGGGWKGEWGTSKHVPRSSVSLISFVKQGVPD